jgi:NTP pyrophosphatase (non-canonical NTP hydrolase)
MSDEIVHAEGFLTFVQYERMQQHTAIYPDNPRLIDDRGNTTALYPFFGLFGEAGEVAEKIKKIMRDSDGIITDATRAALIDELGDILWYISACAQELDIPLGAIAQRNIVKLQIRLQRNKLQGSGDNR